MYMELGDEHGTRLCKWDLVVYMEPGVTWLCTRILAMYMDAGYVHGTCIRTRNLAMYMEPGYLHGTCKCTGNLAMYMEPGYVHGTWLCT